MASMKCFKLLAGGVLLGAALAGGVACVPCSTPSAGLPGADDSPQASKGADKQPPPKDEKLQEEIKKLIEQLGDKSFAVHKKATARLKEIGLPALESLYKLEDATDPEIRRRAEVVIAHVTAAHDLPVLVRGIEFSASVENVWLIPKAEGKKENQRGREPLLCRSPGKNKGIGTEGIIDEAFGHVIVDLDQGRAIVVRVLLGVQAFFQAFNGLSWPPLAMNAVRHHAVNCLERARRWMQVKGGQDVSGRLHSRQLGF